jgi:hypothetical protein
VSIRVGSVTLGITVEIVVVARGEILRQGGVVAQGTDEVLERRAGLTLGKEGVRSHAEAAPEDFGSRETGATRNVFE